MYHEKFGIAQMQYAGTHEKLINKDHLNPMSDLALWIQKYEGGCATILESSVASVEVFSVTWVLTYHFLVNINPALNQNPYQNDWLVPIHFF